MDVNDIYCEDIKHTELALILYKLADFIFSGVGTVGYFNLASSVSSETEYCYFVFSSYFVFFHFVKPDRKM
jgi:hypothetical protein